MTCVLSNAHNTLFWVKIGMIILFSKETIIIVIDIVIAINTINYCDIFLSPYCPSLLLHTDSCINTTSRSRFHIASEVFVRHKKIRPGLIACVFAGILRYIVDYNGDQWVEGSNCSFSAASKSSTRSQPRNKGLL